MKIFNTKKNYHGVNKFIYKPASYLYFSFGFYNPKTPILERESSNTIVDFAVNGETSIVKYY